jgi:hypothetical protein
MTELVNQIATPLLTALSSVIAALIVAALVQFLRKLGLEIGAEKQAKMEKTVQDVILSVDEWGAREEKKTGRPVTSEEKTARAMNELSVDLPNKTPKAITKLVDQELAKVNLGATVPGFRPAPVP